MFWRKRKGNKGNVQGTPSAVVEPQIEEAEAKGALESEPQIVLQPAPEPEPAQLPEDILLPLLRESEPGTPKRWKQFHRAVCRIHPKIERLDQLTEVTSRMFLQQVEDYKQLPEYISLLNTYTHLYPHSLEDVKMASRAERQDQGMDSLVYAYGEVNIGDIVAVIRATRSLLGSKPSAVFYDLGCGAGNVVLAAALLNQFYTCRGVELFSQIHEKTSTVMQLWKAHATEHSLRAACVEFQQADYLRVHDWVAADVVFVHATAFDYEVLTQFLGLTTFMAEGSMIVSVGRELISDDWFIVAELKVRTDYADVNAYVHEKISPPVPRPAS